jgi:hypothetical protein
LTSGASAALTEIETWLQTAVTPKEAEMYFIENLFGISPDGGSGSFEFLLFVIPIVGVGYLTFRRVFRRPQGN